MKFVVLAFMTLLSVCSFAQGQNETISEVGIVIETTSNSTFVIRNVVPGSPAFKAGLMKNDMITSVRKDGTSDAVQTAQMPIEEVTKLLKGSAGTPLTIEFLRHPAPDMKKVTLTRTTSSTKQ